MTTTQTQPRGKRPRPAPAPEPRPLHPQDVLNELVYQHGRNLRNWDAQRIDLLTAAGLDPNAVTPEQWRAAEDALNARAKAEAEGRHLTWEVPPVEIVTPGSPGSAWRWTSTSGQYRLVRYAPARRGGSPCYGAEYGAPNNRRSVESAPEGPGYPRYYDTLEEAARAALAHLTRTTGVLKVRHNLDTLLKSEKSLNDPQDDELELNPLQEKILDARARHPGKVIAFRVDGGYEFYGRDADTLHRLVGCELITYKGVQTTAVPDEEMEDAFAKLLGNGHRIAVVDDDPEDGEPDESVREFPDSYDHATPDDEPPLPVQPLHGTMVVQGDISSSDDTASVGEIPPEECSMVAAVASRKAVKEGPPITFRVKASDARAMFVACEYTAHDWDIAKLQKRLSRDQVAILIRESEEGKPKEGTPERKLLNRVMSAYEEGAPIEVVEDDVWDAAHGETPAPRAKAETNGHGHAVPAAEPPAKRGPGRPKGSKNKKKPAAAPRAKAVKVKASDGVPRMGALDAAERVLRESRKPLGRMELVELMSSKGYWSSPSGKTPQATIAAAIYTEIKSKGRHSRFKMVGRGLFAVRS